MLTLPLLWGTILRGFQRGESLEPWLIVGIYQWGLVQGQLGVFNVGLCGVLDLREAPKGEVVTVGVALYSISNIFSFSGVSKR